MAAGQSIGGALMWPFPNPLDLFGDAIGGVVGWAWDKVIQGIYTWFANGLLLLMEWVWGVLDTATTPRLTRSMVRDGTGASAGRHLARDHDRVDARARLFKPGSAGGRS